jgi:aromatic ring-opening dioxygenase catalytic subunit (LigB family)
MSDTKGITRRDGILAALGATASLVPGCTPQDSSAREGSPMTTNSSSRFPVVYLPHGGGPWPFVEMRLGSQAERDEMASYLRALGTVLPAQPRAVLVISAHWEESKPTVMTNPSPPLFFDYYGFPEAAYQLTWPAPGAPELAKRVRGLLDAAGIESGEDAARGFDHGTFVPLKLTYPAADVPTLQLSLKAGLDPKEHLAIGRALAPLRDEGVFIVGSGMSYHNMRGFGANGRPASEAFDAWLGTTIAADPQARDEGLTSWAAAPAARDSHPREEHLLPLMVIAGAAGADIGKHTFSGSFAGVRCSGYQFG